MRELIVAGFFLTPVVTVVAAGVIGKIAVIEQRRDDTTSAAKNEY